MHTLKAGKIGWLPTEYTVAVLYDEPVVFQKNKHRLDKFIYLGDLYTAQFSVKRLTI